MRLPLIFASSLIGALGCHQAVPVPAPEPNPLPAPIPPLAGAEKVVMALRYIEGRTGLGATAVPRQCVYVHYTGWLRDGTKFDSSRDTTRNGTARTPIAFPLGLRRVIAGWDLGLEGMTVGAQRRLFIPYPFAYGEAGRPPVIPEKAELIFDVELMAVADTLPRIDAAPQPGPSPQCPTWATVKDRPVK
ncbi:MAG TPA: FKBP-type peptidyl-prolyl cis-trans isomerase [Gemmatimonadaceae bacterium]|nr:FKBP-type peptidyl-prolyl cis-trans isomerase [Gemmatimonadaceae bacterium]